jgi:hypothetical protein
LPSTFRKSGTSLGKGKKSDFTKDLTCSPGSTKYLLKTIFDKNVSSKKGFSLYESRAVKIVLFRKFQIEGIYLLDPLKFQALTDIKI